MQGIYAIYGPSGRVYVGQSFDIFGRWKVHQSKLSKRRHENHKLQTAWKKYGKRKFFFIPLEQVPGWENLTDREQFWMDALDASGKGYNICPAAESTRGRPHTPDTKAKQARAARKRQPPSEETKAKLRKAWERRRARGETEETKTKRSEGQKARWADVPTTDRKANTAKAHAASHTPTAQAKRRQSVKRDWAENRKANCTFDTKDPLPDYTDSDHTKRNPKA